MPKYDVIVSVFRHLQILVLVTRGTTVLNKKFFLLCSYTMYKARSVVNNLVPFIPNVAGRERFASWLLSSHRSFSTSRIRVQTTNPVSAEPFLNGNSSTYVEEMYNAWLEDPKSVHKVSWYCTQRCPIV